MRMAETPSTMLPLGTSLPAFRLEDVVTGRAVSSSAPTPKGALVMFVCNHCPFVVHIRKPLVALANDAVERGLSVFAINSNSAATHPQDGPANMKRWAADDEFRFPFLFDETQDVARAFRAACTPDFFLFDAARTLAYRGRFDGSTPGNRVATTGDELRAAIDAVLDGRAPDAKQLPSVGCSIKWHPISPQGSP